MKRFSFCKLAAIMAGAGLCLSQLTAQAAETTPAKAVEPAPVAVDVSLAQGGLLQGQVVDAQGAALKGAPVSIWFENQQIAQTVANENGQFSVGGLRGGVHHVVAGEGYGMFRLWTAQAAPPSAQSAATVVSGEKVVRGQNGQMIGSFLRSPVLWAGLAYTAGHVVGFNAGLDRTPSSP